MGSYVFINIRKMKKNNYLIIFIVVVCIACTKKQDKSAINYFSTVKEITEYDSIYSDKNDEAYGISQMLRYKNILIARNIEKNDYFFSFYDTEKGVFLGSWGKRGQGPDEFNDVGPFSVNNSQITFTDIQKREFIHVSIESILNKEKTIIKREIYPSPKGFFPLVIEAIKDKKIAVGAFENSRFGVLDSDNNIIDNISDYPFNYDEITGIFRGFAFQSNLKSNVEQSKFIITTKCSDIFEIFQITDSGIYRTYLSPFKHIPKITPTPGRNSGFDVSVRESLGGILNMAVTDDLIYFAYTSKNYNESYDSGHITDEILCYNWNGEKIKKYILPFPIDAHSLCVDNDNYIYGTRESDDEMIIYRFGIN